MTKIQFGIYNTLNRTNSDSDTPLHIEWDEAQQRSNLRKHGFDFADTPLVCAGEIVIAQAQLQNLQNPGLES